VGYLISFLEGIVTFISPCLLPMLPLYLAYFAGTANREAELAGDVPEPEMTGAADGGSEMTAGSPTDTGASRPAAGRTLLCACGFVLGFSLVFVSLGALAGTVGSFVGGHRALFDAIGGAIVVVFGLSFMGMLRIPFLERTLRPRTQVSVLGFPSAVLFGVVFAIGWTPCVGAFLGSALLLAAQQGSVLQGVFMLICYSLGLGVPFLISAVVIDRLRGAFDFIKRHYHAIDLICGGLLVVVGLLMAFGLMGTWLAAISI